MNFLAPRGFFSEPHLAKPHMLPYRAMFAELRDHDAQKLSSAIQNFNGHCAEEALLAVMKSKRELKAAAKSALAAERAAAAKLKAPRATPEDRKDYDRARAARTTATWHLYLALLAPKEGKVAAEDDAYDAQAEQAITVGFWEFYLYALVWVAEQRYTTLEKLKANHAPVARVTRQEIACRQADAPLKAILHQRNAAALCLSGGGIRSATFSVGVMQGLARAGLLRGLDFLSTVSGGGYAGCWLMAWANKESWSAVVEKLAHAAPTSGDPEPAPLRHLRDYSCYLNPSAGLGLDTMTLAIIVLRNLILNWIMFAPTLIFLLCLPVLFAGWTAHAAASDPFNNTARLAGAAVLLSLGVVFAMVRIYKQPRNIYPSDMAESGLEWVFLAGPVALACWLVVLCWFHGGSDNQHEYSKFLDPRLGALSAVALAPMAAGWLVRVCWPNRQGRLPALWKRILALFACVPAALTFAGLVWGFAVLSSHTVNGMFSADNKVRYKPNLASDIGALAPFIAGRAAKLAAAAQSALPASPSTGTHTYLPEFVTIFGLPIVLVLVMIGFAVQEGMLSHVEMEEEREWWARGAGMLLMLATWWLLWFGLSLGTDMLMNLGRDYSAQPHTFGMTLGTALALAASWLTAKLGGSRFSGSGLMPVKGEDLSKVKAWVARNGWLPQVLSVFALAVIFFLLSALAAYLRLQPWPGISDDAILLVCGIIALLANYFVNANTFSLHGMYRMRLVRAYLGASNPDRKPNPFTNFDPHDDLPLADVCSAGAPLHLINCNLNLVDTKVLAWQQRKGESFTFSRAYSGSWRTGYVPTKVYAGFRGVKMGTAMAISGAAASPNMGYNSSALMTFLMTLFNARLGWWLPNAKFNSDGRKPGFSNARLMRRNSPRWSLVPLVNEAIGRTDDRFKWIQLSDGGHFENLALYEMVMRRVKTIILVDADADRACQLGDLGNAVRKIYIDLGIPIEMDGVKMGAGLNAANRYCAIGKIRYSCVDGCGNDDPNKLDGTLIYIKPQLNGTEPEDILAYARTHATFPHETTANQFFNESQFESYRHLGSHVMEVVTGNQTAPDHDGLAWLNERCRQHAG